MTSVVEQDKKHKKGRGLVASSNSIAANTTSKCIAKEVFIAVTALKDAVSSSINLQQSIAANSANFLTLSLLGAFGVISAAFL